MRLQSLAVSAFLIAGVSSLALMAQHVPALAQESAAKPGETVVLKEITVQGESVTGAVDGYVAKKSATASKSNTTILETPQAVNIVTADEIADRAADTLTEALDYTPGVLGGLEGGSDTRRDTMTIRGFQPVQYMDGLIATGGTGLTVVTKAEPFNLERIEVLKGPASVLYGMNAPGGLINMTSKRPTEDARGEIVLGGGSFNKLEGQFDVSGPLTLDKSLLYRFVAVGRNADTQTDFQPDDHLFLAPSLTWQPDADTSLTFLGQYSKDNGGVYQSLPLEGTLLPNPNGVLPISRSGGDADFDHYRSEYWNVGYEFNHRFNEQVTFTQNLRYGQHDNDYAGAYPFALQGDLRTVDRTAYRYANQAESFAVDNRMGFDFDTGALSHSVLVGLDYNRLNWANQNGEIQTDSMDIFNPSYPPIGPVAANFSSTDKTSQTGLYTQDVIRYEKLTVMAGVRHDWAHNVANNAFYSYDTTKGATTYRAGATYQFDNGLAPYASYSESFQLQSGMRQDGGTWKPTTGQQYEVGLRYAIPDMDALVTLSAFDLRQQNIVSAIPNTPFSVQTGEVRVRGVEIESKASLNEEWDIVSGIAFLKGKVTKDEDPANIGQQAPNVPDFQATLWVNYTFNRNDKLGGLSLGAGVRHTGSYYIAQYDPVWRRTPSATVFDAHLGYDFGAVDKKYEGLSLNVNATNIFDKRTFAAVDNYFTTDGPRREVTASLGYKW